MPLWRRVAAALLHDVEELGLVALLDLAASLDLHRPAPGVGLHAAVAAARAAGAAHLHHDVPDLGGGAAADPRLPAEDDPAAHAGAPPDAQQRAVAAPRAERELAVDRHLHVVPERDRAAQPLRQRQRERERLLPVGQVPRAGHDPGLGVHRAGRADAHARELVGAPRRPWTRPRAWSRRSARPPPAGRPPRGVGSLASPTTFPRAPITTAWILVPPRSMPPFTFMTLPGLRKQPARPLRRPPQRKPPARPAAHRCPSDRGRDLVVGPEDAIGVVRCP